MYSGSGQFLREVGELSAVFSHNKRELSDRPEFFSDIFTNAAVCGIIIMLYYNYAQK